jgi:SAM-dependent methyltransferase
MCKQNVKAEQLTYKKNLENGFYYQFYDNQLNKLYEYLLHEQQKGKILDIGCGIGTHSRKLSARGFDVIGVDISFESIKLATQQTTIPRGRFLVGSAEALPFHSNYFDIVFCGAVLHHLPEESLAKAAQEIHRILKPHGLLCSFDPNRYNPYEFFAHEIINRFIRIPWRSPNERSLTPGILKKVFLGTGFNQFEFHSENLYLSNPKHFTEHLNRHIYNLLYFFLRGLPRGNHLLMKCTKQ